ncbi:CDP-diacylglycerol--serine O-phosphatidyltransferase [Salipaludibacillus agaradhaerens]|uniref:CDP-diacylglycerol--serine O-phosphatidyltransferase n=1 Tax=Salipaludibacillus agaradhaerens TaxID=76935 RepID=UPI0021511D87|nr:CDP-diacylglycerol--serine O-phosphatidyltransferase [Salipaludibacillus agaradhaerens]MCR6106267.1 CDP-diacylglycerol--serine O-phosphatidyltransferase [Salipaludibacillus agaradhaerens]MCR6118300.1 CDP-diacylglycerol--serine O-phosphatidyltransferase [Salipaludibacillus agaradhaerens]UJW57408.1 CDP-diacylglycerol--serine O-phosphatidyltransferase [Bacillus sp. A116_S68]
MVLLQHFFDSAVKRLRSQTANVMTIMNLGFGSLALLSLLQGHTGLTVAFISTAAILDLLDGKIARKMNIQSELGKQLDSLCDLISFGVAPSLLLFHSVLYQFGAAGAMASIFFIICGAIRLAQFNISNSSGFFIGLPITGAGCLLTISFLFSYSLSPPLFMFLILSLSILMISHFRFKKL